MSTSPKYLLEYLGGVITSHMLHQTSFMTTTPSQAPTVMITYHRSYHLTQFGIIYIIAITELRRAVSCRHEAYIIIGDQAGCMHSSNTILNGCDIYTDCTGVHEQFIFDVITPLYELKINAPIHSNNPLMRLNDSPVSTWMLRGEHRGALNRIGELTKIHHFKDFIVKSLLIKQLKFEMTQEEIEFDKWLNENLRQFNTK